MPARQIENQDRKQEKGTEKEKRKNFHDNEYIKGSVSTSS